MTDPNNPRAPKSSRKKPGREPATIDLKAKVIDNGANRPSVQEDAKPEETTIEAAGTRPEDAVASPEVRLDSGMGTDSIGPSAAAQETPGQDTLAQDSPGQDPLGLNASGQDSLGQDALGQDTSGQDTLGQDALGQDRLGQDTLSHDPVAHDAPTQDAPGPTEPSSRTASSSPPGRRTSPAAMIGSGLLGGLVGAGLVYGLQTWRQPPAQDEARLTQLEQRVSALSRPSTQAGGQEGQPGNLQAVEERIAALENARASFDERLQALQGAAEQAAARAEEALNRPVPEASPAPQNNAALDELTNRLAALEEQVRTGASAATNATNAVQALDRRLAELEQAASRREQRLSEQDQRLAALSTQVTEGDKGTEQASQAGLRVILAERLNDALRNGAPYPEVLEGLRKSAADPARLAPLEPFAREGAPTAAELAQSFEPLGAAILRESRGPAEGWSDRLQRMMDRVVTVRPVDDPGTTGVPSLVARIKQALERGDVAAAAEGWQALPEPSRRMSEEWGRQATSVAQALQASQTIASDALAALNQTAQ